MQKIITNTKAFMRTSHTFMQNNSIYIEKLIDKYKVVRRFFMVGIAVNLYFCYQNLIKILVLRDLKKDVIQKFKKYQQQQNLKKKQVLELLQEMESINKQKKQVQKQLDKSKNKNSTIPLNKNQYI